MTVKELIKKLQEMDDQGMIVVAPHKSSEGTVEYYGAVTEVKSSPACLADGVYHGMMESIPSQRCSGANPIDQSRVCVIVSFFRQPR